MLNSLKQRYSKLTLNEQHILWFDLLFLAALIAAGFYFLPHFLAVKVWQGTLAAGLYGLLIVVALVGGGWIFFGLTRAGSYLLLGGWLAGLLGTILLAEGYTLAFAAAGALAILFIGWELTGSQRAQITVLASWFYAGFLLGMDVLWNLWRVPVSAQDILVGRNLAVMIILVYLFVQLKQFSDYSLRTKVTIVFLVVAFASSGTITALNQVNLTRTLTNNIGETLQNLSQTSATALGDLLSFQVDKLTTLSLDQAVQEGVSGANMLYRGDLQTIEREITQREMNWRVAFAANDLENSLVKARLTNTMSVKLREFVAVFPEYQDVLITDRYGALMAATRLVPRYSYADTAWWKAAYNNGEGALYVGIPEYSPRFGEFILTIAVPIRDLESGRVIGVLNASYRPRALVGILQLGSGSIAQTDLIFPSGLSLYLPGELMLETKTTTVMADMDELALAVANNPDAVGFLPYSYYIRHADRVRPVVIEGIPLSAEMVQQGIYPFSRTLYLYADPATIREKPQVAEFIHYFISHADEENQTLGYFPLGADIKAGVLETLKSVIGAADSLPPPNPKTVSSSFSVLGSNSLLPLVYRMAERFRSDGFKGSLSVSGGGTSVGFQAYCQGEPVDIVMASRPMNERERGQCLKVGRKPIAFAVSHDAIVVIVSQDNNFLSNATLKDLLQIFAKTESWAAVRSFWPERSIIRFVPIRQFFDTYTVFLQGLFDRGAMLDVQPGLLQVANELAKQGRYVDTKYYGGKESLASVQPVRTTLGSLEIDNLGWLLSLHADKERVLAPVQEQTRRNLLLTALILIATSVVSIAFSSVIVNPILRLTEMARSVAAGKLETRANIRSGDEIGVLASVFDSTTAQLQDLIGTLEQRVADRTLALQTSTEVSRRLSTILDPSQLLLEVVEQLQSAFGYYHAHIYLFDQNREYLVMKGGTGEAGRIMLARGHKIPRGRGLVGRAAEINAPVFVPDVSEDMNWLPNPLLPETKAEVAVPIAVGDQVLGVLDVQHNVLGVLKEESVALIQGIASQVAIALQNAEAYERAQRQAQRKTLLAELSGKIQSAVTIEDVLKTAVEGLGQALKARRSGIELGMRRPPQIISERDNQLTQEEDGDGFEGS